MAHLSTKNLQKILDQLVDKPSWSAVAATIGASESLMFNWAGRSRRAEKDNDRSSEFFLEWSGSWDFWHCHCGRARAQNIALYESVIRDECLNGREVPVLGPDQRPVFAEDPDLIDVSDEDLWNLYGRRNRYLLDKKGRPVPLTKREFPPAPIRLRVLEQDRRYVHTEKHEHDVALQGEITVQKPLQRLPGEARPDIARLKQLAAMSPADRRAAIGATAVPLDAAGRRTLPPMAPTMSDPPDDKNLGARPSPYAPYEPKSPAPAPEPAPRPSYARPTVRLDKGEDVGDGLNVPPGGYKVA